jgi:hypothetical protein
MHITKTLIDKYPNLKHRKEHIRTFINRIERLIASEVFSYETNVSFKKVVNIIEDEFHITKEKEKIFHQDNKETIKDNLREIKEKIDELESHSIKEDIRKNKQKHQYKNGIAPFINPDLPLKKLDIINTKNSERGISSLIKSLILDLYYEMGLLSLLIDVKELSIQMLENETNLKSNIELYNTYIKRICFFNYDNLKYAIEQSDIQNIISSDFKLNDEIFIKRFIKDIIGGFNRDTIRDQILNQCPNAKDEKKILNQFVKRIQFLIDSKVFNYEITNSMKSKIFSISKCSNKKTGYVNDNDFVMFLHQNKVEFTKTALKNYHQAVKTIIKEEIIINNPLKTLK